MPLSVSSLARRLCSALAGLGALAALAWPVAATAADFVGIVHPRHHLTLSFAVAGLVTRVLVEPGRRVEAQETLIELDERVQLLEEQRRRIVFEDQSEIRANEERLRIVQPLAEDARRLAATRAAISREDAARSELDFLATRGRLAQLEAQKKREQAELQSAEQERLARRLQAPVGGVVTKIGVDLGEWARPGEMAIELIDASVLHLRVNVPAAAARRLRVGVPLAVAFEPGLGADAVNGQISFISPAVDAASGLVELRVRFANPGGRLSPGIKGTIKLETGPAR